MEILLEPTSNKLMVAENIVKEILLKLNLPDHRTLKDKGDGTCFELSQRFIAACSYPTINDKVLKLKNFKKDASKSSQVIKSRKCLSNLSISLKPPLCVRLQVPSPASPEEPTRKSKRVKRPAKKSFDASVLVVIIRETPVKSLSKKKEKMIVEKCKGIDLLSEVALTKEAQHEEVCKKSLKDFYKTHPSVSGTVTKITPSAAKIKPSVTNEGIGTKPGIPNVTEKESTKSQVNYWGRDEDDNNNDHDSRSEGSDQERDNDDDNTQSNSEKGSDFKHDTDENELGSESDQEENEKEIKDDTEEEEDKFVKTPSNDTDDEDETKIKDKTEGDEDEGMNYTTNQFNDDVNVRLNEPITTDEEFIQKEGIDAEMTNF
nr:hypothetical protein [Tanacetum cinerariifolium]